MKQNQGQIERLQKTWQGKAAIRNWRKNEAKFRAELDDLENLAKLKYPKIELNSK